MIIFYVILGGIVWLLIGILTIWLSRKCLSYCKDMSYLWIFGGVFILGGFFISLIEDKIEKSIERKTYDNRD